MQSAKSYISPITSNGSTLKYLQVSCVCDYGSGRCCLSVFFILCWCGVGRRKWNRKALCLQLNWGMLRAVSAGRSGWEPQRVGCLAVLTFASVPLCGGDESSGPVCFPLLRRWPCWSELQAAQQGPSSLFKHVWDCEALINVLTIPSCPIEVAPLEGRLAGQPPLFFFFFFALLLFKHGCLSSCQCLCGVSLGEAWRTCFVFFPPLKALTMSPGQSLWEASPVLDLL